MVINVYLFVMKENVIVDLRNKLNVNVAKRNKKENAMILVSLIVIIFVNKNFNAKIIDVKLNVVQEGTNQF